MTIGNSRELANILSVIGSNLRPNSLVELNFLANNPSKASVRANKLVNIAVNKIFPVKALGIINIGDNSLDAVKIFGICFFLFFFIL